MGRSAGVIITDIDYEIDRTDGRTPPHQRLWRAVLAIAVADAAGNRAARKKMSLAARRWLTADHNPDRTFVCDAAKVDENQLIERARDLYQ